MLHFSIIFNLFSLELYTRLEQYNTKLKNLKQGNYDHHNTIPGFFWSIGFSNNTNSWTPTFKHPHNTIKLGAWRWSLTFITFFSHIPTPHHFRFNFNSFASRNFEDFVFQIQYEKLGFEVFWIGKNLTTYYWRKFWWF